MALPIRSRSDRKGRLYEISPYHQHVNLLQLVVERLGNNYSNFDSFSHKVVEGIPSIVLDLKRKEVVETNSNIVEKSCMDRVLIALP